MKYFFLTIVIPMFFLMACGQGEPNCAYESLSTIQSIHACNGNDCYYNHQVLSEGLSEECLDSIVVMKIVNDYIGKTLADTPIGIIDIFCSKVGYDEGETLSQPARYYDNRILTIRFPNESDNDTTFVFYKQRYQGMRWKERKIK